MISLKKINIYPILRSFIIPLEYVLLKEAAGPQKNKNKKQIYIRGKPYSWG